MATLMKYAVCVPKQMETIKTYKNETAANVPMTTTPRRSQLPRDGGQRKIIHELVLDWPLL